MSGNPPIQLHPLAMAVARDEADAIRRDVTGISAVVIATVDGFDVASSIGGSLDAARVAALASSIAAIGDVVSSEARLGKPQSVTVNTDAGFAVVHGVRRGDIDLVISVVAGPDAILAQVNYRTSEAARKLAAA